MVQGTSPCSARGQTLLACHSIRQRNQEERLSSAAALAGQPLVMRKRGEEVIVLGGEQITLLFPAGALALKNPVSE